MRTLLFSNQGLSPIHLGIELEIIESEIAKGNTIDFLFCKSNLQSCFFNASHNLLACSICESRTKVFYSKVGISNTSIHYLKNNHKSFSIPQINEMEDVFKLKYKGMDVGRGIAASYISTRRNYEFQKEDQEFISEMYQMCANVIDNLEELVEKLNPDQIYLFNGRFAEQNAIIEYCVANQLNYFTYERSSAKGKYKFFKNMLPHSLKFRGQELERLRKEASEDEIKEIGKTWFDKRQGGGEGVVKKFLSKQEKGSLPKSFDDSKENIAIFVASEDEHAAVKEHQSELFKTQNYAVNKIIEHFKNDTSIHFYLRVHPHLRNIESAQISEIKAMNFPNLTIIHAEEKIDSYHLMKSCDKTIAFGSATGIEACYLGKTSILFGHAYYESIDVCYHPATYEELYELIQKRDLPPKPKENCYIFGYYQNVIGIPYNKFQEGGKENSKYNGDTIKRIYPSTIGTMVRNLSQFEQWRKMNSLIFKQGLSTSNMFKLNSHVFNEKLK